MNKILDSFFSSHSQVQLKNNFSASLDLFPTDLKYFFPKIGTLGFSTSHNLQHHT